MGYKAVPSDRVQKTINFTRLDRVIIGVNEWKTCVKCCSLSYTSQ